SPAAGLKEVIPVPQTRLYRAPLVPAVMALALAGGSSDKGALLAPTDAVITMASAAPLVTVNGTVQVTVRAVNADGTPVADGTEVLLTGSRGEFNSPKVRVRDGQVLVTYHAPEDPGLV